MRERTRGFAFAALALTFAPGVARAQAAAPGRPTIHEWTLPNGLSVAHVERPGLPMVTVQVWYRLGSSDEPAGQRGAARVFERLMFDGSDRVRPDQHRRTIEGLGGQTTSLTTEDVTAFHNTVPAEYLDTALELEAERMRHLMIRESAVEQVKAQLVEDLRQQQASPVYHAYETMLASAWAGQPYAVPPTGVRSDIEQLTTAKVKALYDAYYVPNNALLVVVGGVGQDEVKKAVERWFASIPKGGEPGHPAGKPPAEQTEARRQELQGSPMGLVLVGYRLPEAQSPDIEALQLCGAILTGGKSSRLHQKLVEGKLADEIGGQVLVHQRGGILVAYARFTDQPGGLSAVEKAMTGEIERLATQGPTAAEVKRARSQVLASIDFGMESATGLANQIGVSWALVGKASRFLADLDALEKLGPAEVKKAAATYLATKRQTIVVAEPTARPAPRRTR